MKLIATLTVVTALSAASAQAESRIETLCGANHVNEVAAPDDVVANPDGYYIRSLETQISHGDPRIIQATGRTFHLCTRSAATPDMSTTMALTLMDEREVTHLFVPLDCPKSRPAS